MRLHVIGTAALAACLVAAAFVGIVALWAALAPVVDVLSR